MFPLVEDVPVMVIPLVVALTFSAEGEVKTAGGWTKGTENEQVAVPLNE
jgi:hypothetical protein